ncbi:MAG: hypothetical protein JO235_07520 [Chroococcidiopsidaceae cyanobacterium CP_BM_RX_35]|nr:hypothetical protein [Chroococcidiopsidaceae cyanobacterium CP_BM_RX_35]
MTIVTKKTSFNEFSNAIHATLPFEGKIGVYTDSHFFRYHVTTAESIGSNIIQTKSLNLSRSNNAVDILPNSDLISA